MPLMPVPFIIAMEALPSVVRSMIAYTPGVTFAVMVFASAPLASLVPAAALTACSFLSWSRKLRSCPAHGLDVESRRLVTTHAIGFAVSYTVLALPLVVRLMPALVSASSTAAASPASFRS